MGLAVKETAAFLIQKSKKGFKVYGKEPGLTPKYGTLISEGLFAKLAPMSGAAFDVALVIELDCMEA